MKRLKIILVAIVLLAFNNCIYSQTFYNNSSSGINLRSDKNTSSKVISSIPTNGEVKVIDKNGDWWKVEYKGQIGYVKSDLLSAKKTEDNSTTPKKAKKEPKSIRTTTSDYSSDNSDKCYDEKSHLINLGAGLGRSYYSFGNGKDYTHSQSPAFSLTYEQPLKKRVGPGFIGVGGYFGYQTEKYKYTYHHYADTKEYYWQYRWNYFLIAARGAYHLDFVNKRKYEAYAGVVMGLRIISWKYDDNDPDNDYETKYSAAYFSYSAFVGGRYYFTKNFGAYAELGYGISYATIGLTLKM